MKQWKQILCAAALIAGTGLFAESYTSDGFSAEISKNGMLMNLKYKGQIQRALAAKYIFFIYGSSRDGITPGRPSANAKAPQ